MLEAALLPAFCQQARCRFPLATLQGEVLVSLKKRGTGAFDHQKAQTIAGPCLPPGCCLGRAAGISLLQYGHKALSWDLFVQPAAARA